MDINAIVKCICLPGWHGQLCNLNDEQAKEYADQLISGINNIKNGTIISDEQLDNIIMIQSLTNTNKDLINQELKDNIQGLTENQLNLVAEGLSPAKKKLLNLLDFSFQLSL